MYAHQVIEDLQKTLKTANDEYYLAHTRNAINKISNAQKFFLGDYKDLYENFEKNYKYKLLFLDPEMSSGIRLPYDKCWFDFQNTMQTRHEGTDFVRVPKRGMLTEKVGDDSFIVWIFNEIDEDMIGFGKKHWYLSILCYYFNVGCTISLESMQKDIDNNQEHRWIPRIIYCKGNGSNSNIYPLPTSMQAHKQMDKSIVGTVIKDDLDDLACLNLALMLLSCKNIETEQIKAPMKLNKKRQKKGKLPIFTYKTLVLKPMGKKQESIPKNLWENRIHLCRGHFKTYTDEKPLFGKYTGRFWWQPSVRGRNKDGVIHKDYQLETTET